MSGEDNAEARLRELLRDPRWSLPAGPDPEQRVRRAAQRQRLRLAGMAGVAAAAVIAVAAIPAGMGAFGHLHGPAQPNQRPAAPTLYIYGYSYPGGAFTFPIGGTVTPINTATNTPGRPIRLDRGLLRGGSEVGHIVITPGGRTAYVTGPGTVTPINTTTNTPGTPIHIPGGYIRAIAITPDGKTAYVTSESGTVTPISTATNIAGTPIHIGGSPRCAVGQIAITPDGKTAYVTTASGVTPINTTTNTLGTPIHLGRALCFNDTGFSENIAITPDGKTVYVLDQRGTVTPINTTTNAPGTPIPSNSLNLFTGNIAITPDGKTAYVTATTFCDTAGCTVTVTPINTATNTAGTPIKFDVTGSAGGAIGQIAITPDGRTAYVTTGPTVTPINTATNTPGTPIQVGGNPSFYGGQIVITPGGKTVYVTNRWDVTPINTATNTPGRPIHVGSAEYQAVAITP